MPIKECEVVEVSQLHFAFFVVELYDSKVHPVWHIVISDAAPYIFCPKLIDFYFKINNEY